MKNILPYLLPILTIILITSILFLKQNYDITGFTVFRESLSGDVEISTYGDKIIPIESRVIISLNEEVKEMSVKEFIEISGGEYMLEDRGYSGDFVYRINIEKFNFTQFKDKNELKVKIVYEDKVISESKAIF